MEGMQAVQPLTWMAVDRADERVDRVLLEMASIKKAESWRPERLKAPLTVDILLLESTLAWDAFTPTTAAQSESIVGLESREPLEIRVSSASAST